MMRVKKYVARSLAEAIVQAKAEMGREAFIVDSRKRRVGGIFGIFGRNMTEVTVAVDDKAGPGGASPAKGPVNQEPKPVASQNVAPQAPATQSQAPTAQLQAQSDLGKSDVVPVAFSSLEREVAGLRAAVSRLMDHPGPARGGDDLAGYGREAFASLVACGVDEDLALEIGGRIRAEGAEGQDLFRRELESLLGPGAPIAVVPGQRRIVALVGPTGVGKTTTLAKLAARFTLEQGLRVSLVTSDTFRIAAIDQLRTYADILGVPLYTVDTPAQVAEAMRATADFDLVLVDTGGRNHKDAQRMQELRDLLAILRPDETHLVFSLTTNPRDAMEALDFYLPLGVNRLTFTKLDEATCPGLMVNVRMRCNQPLSYLTNGQSVPEDIAAADRVDFTKILLGA